MEPNRTLSHYRLIEKIGEGGMGVVWKAEDTVLGRTVAVKVLPADLARDEQRRKMFLDEARLASSVSEAHIVQVFEFGREGDLDFIVMEYVEGKPLSQVLKGRSLTPDRIAEIGHQVARALARAHRKGLLHRDLKPSNILITPEGDAKVVDFGLAALFTRGESTFGGDSRTLSEVETRTGSERSDERRIAGTLPYMSPEQVRGEDLDARSDIFSLGVVLYEMTTGQRPFAGATALEVAQRIQEARPKPVHEVVPDVPLDLDRSIHKALAPRRGERYQTMDDLAVDLKRLARDLESGSSPSFGDLQGVRRLGWRGWLWALGGTAGIAAIGAGLWWWSSPRLPEPDPRTVLVAPMDVLGQPAEADYLGRAFAETIAVNLAQSRGLTVLPVAARSEADATGRGDLMAAARKAGAGRLLTGALTREGAKFHATISLIDPARNRLVWGSQGDSDGASLSPLANSLSREVAAQMGAARSHLYNIVQYMSFSPQVAASSEYTDVLAAWRHEGRVPVLEASRRLVTKFPEDALVHSWYLIALANTAFGFGPSSPERRAYEDEALVVMRLNPRDPQLDFWRAYFEMLDGRLRDSIATYGRLVARDDLAPALRSSVLACRALAHSRLDEQEAALADIRAAIALDPLNPEVHWLSSLVLAGSRRYEDALATIRRAIKLLAGRGWEPYDFPLGYFLYRVGRWTESVEPLRRACASGASSTGSPGTSNVISQDSCALLAMALQHDGQTEEARKVAEKAATAAATGQGLWYLAGYQVLTRERAKALGLLRKSIELGAVSSPAQLRDLETGQDFADLRDAPEFQKIVAEARKRIAKQ